MLKRIKVRGKLLLLLATPIIAVIVFAATGVFDRTENSDFQAREARIADLADAGSDLSLAVQVERTRGLAAEAGADLDLTGAQEATTAAIDRWLATAAAVRGDIRDEDLVLDLDELTDSLTSMESRDEEMSMSALSSELTSASRKVSEINIALANEPSDLDLFRALGEHIQIAQVQDAIAEITALGANSIEQGRVASVSETLLEAADVQIDTGIRQFLDSADDQYVAMVQALRSSGELPNAARESALTDVQFAIDFGGFSALTDWLADGEHRLTSVNAVSDALLEDTSSAASGEATAAEDQARGFIVLAGSIIALALVLAVVVGRSISRPLTRLTQSAEQLSSEELPALVETLQSGQRADAAPLTPIEVSGRDEVAQLAAAISDIQQVTVDVAEQQGNLLRRGISDIFVNLARRNQSLLDRQIDFIDQLEAREENPDQLENLFRLDHLATRMRRNAESLLVLAGAEPTRRRGRPVEVADVVRVAMGEIEDYSRIELLAIDEATVAGSVAVDLAHLLSELMENATQFSPPEAAVEVIGRRADDGSYGLVLTDRGIGMSTEAINAANATLAEPPVVGLDLSRSLGFTVVSRLANRLGVLVELSGSSHGGVTATVTVPPEMVGTVSGSDEPSAGGATVAPDDDGTTEPPTISAVPDLEPFGTESPFAQVPDAASGAEKVPDSPVLREVRGFAPLDHEEQPPFAPVVSVPDSGSAPLPTRAEGTSPAEPAAPSGDMFDAISPQPDMPEAPTDPGADMFAPIGAPTAADSNGSPDETGVTKAGLTRRVPRQVDVPEQSKFTAGAGPKPAETAAPTTRTPEEVRQMLSRYRSGRHQGRSLQEGTEQPTHQG